jgi:Protein of unknown function (DUF732)
MLKLSQCLMLFGVTLGSTLATAISPTQASDLVAYDNRGDMCASYNASGYMIVDPYGRLVNLRDYCNTQKAEGSPQQSQSFWEQFVKWADADAIAFANNLDRQDVVAYGATICPFLQNGGSLSDLRQLQADAQLPTGFESAITAAAVNTYCPGYRSAVGL